jgi:hypothetical protein
LGISPDKQCLYFSGRQLENDKRLHDYCVKDGSVIKLHITEEPPIPIKIQIKTLTGITFTVSILLSESIKQLKAMIQ